MFGEPELLEFLDMISHSYIACKQCISLRMDVVIFVFFAMISSCPGNFSNLRKTMLVCTVTYFPDNLTPFVVEQTSLCTCYAARSMPVTCMSHATCLRIQYIACCRNCIPIPSPMIRGCSKT